VKLSELMTKDVAVCRLDSTLESAANLFWSGDVGILPVVDAEGRVLGMVTDRDVCLSGFFRGRPLHEIAVGEAMSSTVVSCRATDSLEDALEKMTSARVRRLPIVDAKGQLEGMIGLMDVVHTLSAKKLTLKAAKGLLETLGAIGSPHGTVVKGAAPVELKPAAKAPAKTAAKGKQPAKAVAKSTTKAAKTAKTAKPSKAKPALGGKAPRKV